ncbi:L,D-transpeptidase family protein [Halarcobacter ebronensis]|uniref:L,D-TPase catalytic domain-containing protein n=1 Tax=Halarcobacter ebronensis TaxID=1462615 RepID=A0A4V1M0S0_9BACT|nr:L,D-transpeptidase family protein [Halarcobacter ebronensis]QKF82315.1 murein L,D-transpeptidase, YcbB/YkuD family [Halarcobacter ebronensis]RXK07655.1 hypothetical protein CRV07_04115 [Halarcobacter ebronensis]
MNKIYGILFILFFSFNLFASYLKSDQFNEVEYSNLHLVSAIEEALKQKQNLDINSRLLYKYYKKHKFKPFFTQYRRINNLAVGLINEIKNDEALKLNLSKLLPLDQVDIRTELLKNNPTVENIINFDFLLVSVYHKYMTLLSKGSVNWSLFQKELDELKEKENINANWQRYKTKKDIRLLLYKAYDYNNIHIALDEVNYTFLNAKLLSEAIHNYEQMAKSGGYIKIPNFHKALKLGEYYPEIGVIRERLKQNNLITQKDKDIETINIDKSTSSININNNTLLPIKNSNELYDKELLEAIKKFQKNHGLIPDGIIGKNTLNALNMPIEEKIKKMRINLERMRWLPRNLGDKYILVNIPDFTMKMYSNKEKILDMPIIVGGSKHPTPIFSHRMSQIVLNPYWRIPQGIVKDEIIPNLIKNPNYLEEEDIKIHENWDHDSIEYDTKEFDWNIFLNNNLIGNEESAPMRFIQIPGDKNPLGKMKFLFPNQYSVYLHDTPFKNLFENSNRALSHGCIRLSNPKDLLKTILSQNSKISYEEADEILKNRDRVEFELDKKIPVHIVYLTSWIDEEGELQFRNDVYGYDKMQEKLLF